MCGIAGFLDLELQPATLLESMLTVITHRGPDDSGVYHDGPLSMGMRRLSIIDVVGGHQPIANEDGSVWIVYNGEVFNHAAVRPALEQAGHRYRTHSDTETILHAFEEYGDACVTHFRGMFAFAIWDTRRRRLFIARDRMGIKPLYYFWDGRRLVFGSEIKALFKHPSIAPRLDESSLAETLAFGYTSSDHTLFSGIQKLLPGHTMTLDASGQAPRLDIRQYWDLPAQGHGAEQRRSDSEWIADCRQRLEETVRMRLMSDVPLGMFLSGGVDSSAIAALAQRMMSNRVQTFAVGYREEAYSELTWARQVAEAIGTEHREAVVGREDFFGALPQLIWHEDEPIAWPSSVSLYFLSKLARQHVTVVLTGEGSDELFGGYERYGHQRFNMRWGNLWKMAPGPLRRAVRGAIERSPLLSGDWRRKLKHTFLGRDLAVESLYFDNFYCALPASEQRALGMRADLDPYQHVRRIWQSQAGRSALGQMLATDQKTYLVELLMKQDQMSMAASIESRVPFLDHTFVEFAWRVPDALKLRGNESKYILKKAVEDVLPASIIYRKKMGFPTPLQTWLREAASAPLLDSLTSGDGLLAAYFDRAALGGLVERHRQGQIDATDALWRLLNVQIWGDLYITGRRHEVEEREAASRPVA